MKKPQSYLEDPRLPENEMNDLDFLFRNVKEYRSSKKYKEIMDFTARFKHLAPFNAMMVYIQRPGCRFLLTMRQWKTMYQRAIKPNARPLVILSFQPVSYVYDISDTEPIGEVQKGNQELLEEINKQFETKQPINKKDLEQLIENLPSLGIAYSEQLFTGSEQSAQIEILPRPREIKVRVDKNRYCPYDTKYLLSVRNSAETSEKFTAILHELGHFFCHHLHYCFTGATGWKYRDLQVNVEEFEAEATAWHVCSRLGIDNPSEKYLAGYLDENEEIPEGISIDAIFKAHNEIWKILFGNVNAKQSFLYRNCEDFKNIIDNMK